jgi:hypothetical protein
VFRNVQKYIHHSNRFEWYEIIPQRERERERERIVLSVLPRFAVSDYPLWNLKIIPYIHAKNVYRITRMCFNYLSFTFYCFFLSCMLLRRFIFTIVVQHESVFNYPLVRKSW